MYYCSVILLKGLEEFKISIICSLNVVLLFIIHENIFRGGLKSEQMYVLKPCSNPCQASRTEEHF